MVFEPALTIESKLVESVAVTDPLSGLLDKSRIGRLSNKNRYTTAASLKSLQSSGRPRAVFAS